MRREFKTLDDLASLSTLSSFGEDFRLAHNHVEANLCEFEVGVDGADFDSLFGVERHFQVSRFGRENLHDRRKVSSHIDAMQNGLWVSLALFIEEAELVGGARGLVLGVQRQVKRDRRLAAIDLHRQCRCRFAVDRIKLNASGADVAISSSMNRYAGAVQTTNVALSLLDPVRQVGVGRKLVDNAIDDHRRSGVRLHMIES